MDDRTMPFSVVRTPGFTELIRLIRASEVVHLAGPALLPLFLSWLLRKKIVIQHHNYQAVCSQRPVVAESGAIDVLKSLPQWPHSRVCALSCH